MVSAGPLTHFLPLIFYFPQTEPGGALGEISKLEANTLSFWAVNTTMAGGAVGNRAEWEEKAADEVQGHSGVA